MISARKFVSGKATKQVDCCGCGRSYEYELSRTVWGKSSKSAVTQEEADAQAMAEANTKLEAALAKDCDPVACPSCGAFSMEMKAYRWKRFRAALALLGVGAAVFLVVFLMMLFLHRILIFAALLGAVCVLLGSGLLLVCVIDMVAPKKGRV